MRRKEWKWRHNNPKPVEHYKSSAKGKFWRRQWHPTPVLLHGKSRKAAVHGVAEGRTRLSNFTFTFHFHALEKETATHSIVLVWRIPGMEQSGGLPSMGSHRVGHDWSDLAAVLRGKFIAIHEAYLKKQEKSQINNVTLHLKQLEKEEMENPQVSRRKKNLKN